MIAEEVRRRCDRTSSSMNFNNKQLLICGQEPKQIVAARYRLLLLLLLLLLLSLSLSLSWSSSSPSCVCLVCCWTLDNLQAQRISSQLLSRFRLLRYFPIHFFLYTW